jgi:hypothetical protein
MKAMNIPMPKGVPFAGAYGALANGWGVVADQPEGFEPTPGQTPDEVPTEAVVQEVTDDSQESEVTTDSP